MFPVTAADAQDLNTFRNAMASGVQAQTTATQGVSYLMFSGKTGIWSYGSDKEEVTGDIVVVNSRSFMHGWHMWVASRLAVENLVSVLKPLPEAPEPKPNPVNPNLLIHAQEARSLQCVFEDDDTRSIIQFASGSYGGRRACNDLLTQVQVKASQGSDFLFPICRLDASSYEMESKEDGSKFKVFNPVFTVMSWMDNAGNKEQETAMLDTSNVEVPDPTPEQAPIRRKRTRRV